MHKQDTKTYRWLGALVLGLALFAHDATADQTKPKPTPTQKPPTTPAIDPISPIPWMATPPNTPPPRTTTPPSTRKPASGGTDNTATPATAKPALRKADPTKRHTPPSTQKPRSLVRAVFGSGDAPQLDP